MMPTDDRGVLRLAEEILVDLGQVEHLFRPHVAQVMTSDVIALLVDVHEQSRLDVVGVNRICLQLL